MAFDRIERFIILFLLVLFVSACNEQNSPPEGAVEIVEVSNVRLAVMKGIPSQLLITTTGKVSSSGWEKPALAAFQYIQPPSDGIYDFTFVAVPPAGTSLQVISDISSVYHMNPIPIGLKGVRIRAKNNEQVVYLN